ncbi:MAG: trypsin-like peptidase domain-containing protein [Crocinitomicaceae bacterium]|nr:trypsin-like peptidase domain-containing protein [Crocinitomicaceae bacterium]
MKRKLCIALSIFSIISCNQQPNNELEQSEKRHQEELHQKQTELELKEKELQLKEKELQLLEQSIENEPEELKDIYNNVKSSVYLVYTKNEEGFSQGSAFMVSSNGIAVSNYHVFKNASGAILYNELEQEFLITEVLDLNEEEDFIVFRVGEGTTNLPFVKLSRSMPDIGEECFAVGNPKGLTQTLSTGIISSFRDNKRLLQTTTEITNGSSGGPLFNRKGEAIGITTSGIGEANLNFAINIESLELEKFINQNSIGTSTKITENEIKSIIESYYQVLDKGEYNKLNSYYRDNLKRFYSKYNISKSEAITDAMNYDEKYKITDKNTNIKWSSLEFRQDNLGGQVVNFIMDYTITRKEKNKPTSFVLYITMGVDENRKIYSVYENILKSK